MIRRPTGMGPLLALGVLLGALLGPPVPKVGAEPSAEAAAAPAGRVAAEIVLTPADLGPDFLIVSSGQRVIQGFSAYTQNLVRGGHGVYLAPEGIFGVRSVALVLPDAQSADRAFDAVGQQAFADLVETAVPPIGDRTRAGVAWGKGPFEAALRLVLFRAGNTVGFVAVSGYEAPSSLDDAARLAATMEGRARG
jgi:hypothetical protein